MNAILMMMTKNCYGDGDDVCGPERVRVTDLTVLTTCYWSCRRCFDAVVKQLAMWWGNDGGGDDVDVSTSWLVYLK